MTAPTTFHGRIAQLASNAFNVLNLPAAEKRETDRKSDPNPAAAADYSYSFEKPMSRWGRSSAPRGTFQTRKDAEPDVQSFLHRLNLAGNDSVGILSDEIERFVINHQLNIAWYQQRLAAEERMRTTFFIIGLLLLLLIPAVLAFTPGLITAGIALSENLGADPATAEKLASAPTVVTAQISAVLTGFFAFYRALSAYFDKRELVGIWSRTIATLKQQLYGFEQTWEVRFIDIDNREEFASALREATGKARDIVIDEQRQFYENLSYPNMDLGGLLKSAADDSAAALAPALAQAKRSVDRQTELMRVGAQLDSRIQLLTGTLNHLTEQLQKNPDREKEATLRDQLLKTVTELRSAELDRAVVARSLGNAL